MPGGKKSKRKMYKCIYILYIERERSEIDLNEKCINVYTVSGPSLSSRHTHVIYSKPTCMNPSTFQTSHLNCVNLSFPTRTQRRCNSMHLPFSILYPSCPPAPSPHFAFGVWLNMGDNAPSGFDFPRGPGAYAPRFCCGPIDFSVWGPKVV